MRRGSRGEVVGIEAAASGIKQEVRLSQVTSMSSGLAAATLSVPGRVAVLLATHDGVAFLGEQLDSILAQRGIEFDVWISDDGSSDGTFEYLQHRSRLDPRIRLLPSGCFGSAADNFLRLLRDVSLEHYGYIALADQDDIWMPLKLRIAIEQLAQFDADGYSSNLVAFDDRSGREWIIHKSSPPKALDYLFGGASAGCTYVLSSRASCLIRQAMQGRAAPARGWSHDWLFYAICRSNGLRWVFDSASPIRYRQHSANQYGARSGLVGVGFRILNIANGWYRERILENGEYLCGTRAEVAVLLGLRRLSLGDRIRLAACGWRLRRRLRDGVVLSLAFLLMPRCPIQRSVQVSRSA